MRHILIVLSICVVAIIMGILLYVYGPSELREVPVQSGASAISADAAADVPFSVLVSGTSAVAQPERKNFAVYGEEDFQRLWEQAYGEEAPVLPSVNFEEEYVIGVFAGERSSGGYAIAVSRVTDENAVRTVTIALTTPGPSCAVTQALTSPFQFVTVPLSDRTLARVDQELEASCD